MKTNLLLLLNLACLSVCAQSIDINIYNRETTDGYQLFADNNEYCPVSVIIDNNLSNMKVVEGAQDVYVLPANSRNVPLMKLAVVNIRKKFGYSLGSSVNYGDITLREYDADFQYHLPFEKGQSFEVNQGYNGSFSHRNENALDFAMKEGTPVLAARGGRVVQVVENNRKNCGSEACKAYNNFILIYHDDGSFANYSHLEYNGAAVKVGDTVRTGDLLGYSGNTGWSTGPHLHFEVFLSGMNEKESLKTKFLVNDGRTSVFLEERNRYARNY